MRHSTSPAITRTVVRFLIQAIPGHIALRGVMLTTVLLALGACSADEPVEQRIDRAQQYLAEAEYTSAIIELKGALQKQADSAEARWLLGKVYLKTADAPSAEKELERAGELGWDINEVTPALARAQLLQGKFVRVRETSVGQLAPSAAASVLSTKALAELAQGETDAAEVNYDLAFEQAPDSIDVKMAEAQIKIARQDSAAALIVLEEVLRQNPTLTEAWSVKGDLLSQEGDMNGALGAFDKAISNASHSALKDRYKRALINIDLQNYEAAQHDADRLLKAAPSAPPGNYVQGLIYLRNNKHDEAIPALSLVEPMAHEYPRVLYFLGTAHFMAGSMDQADLFAKRFYAFFPENIEGRKLLASIRLYHRRFEDVQELLQPVLEQHPQDIYALNLMADALMGSGKSNQGLEMLTRAAQLEPDSPAGQARLGVGLSATGHFEEGAKSIETARQLAPDWEGADFLLVQNYVQQKEFDKAIEVVKAYIQRHPDKVVPRNLLGTLFLDTGKREEAVASFEDALRLDAGDPGANHLLAQLALEEGNLSAARQHYEVTLAHYPNSLQALVQLAYLDAREQKEEPMVEHLQTAMEAHPKALEPRILLARYYLGRGQADQVAALFAPLDDLQKKMPEVLWVQARSQLAEQNPLDAQLTLEQLLEATPPTPQIHHMLAMTAATSGNREGAKQQLEMAVALDENFVPALTELARGAQIEGATAEFQKYLAKLMQLAPDTQEVLRIRASAAYRNGNQAEAVDLASRAFATTPTSTTMLELALYQNSTGNSEEALQTLELWTRGNPNDIPARLALADYLLVEQRLDDALAHYNAILEIDPDTVTALNNVAWNTRLENPELALEQIRRAANLAPDQPSVLDSLAIIEHLNGNNRRAHRNIQRALAGAPGNPSMLYHRALIESAIGEKSAAIALLEDLLAPEKPNFAERAQAQALLESLQE